MNSASARIAMQIAHACTEPPQFETAMYKEGHGKGIIIIMRTGRAAKTSDQNTIPLHSASPVLIESWQSQACYRLILTCLMTYWLSIGSSMHVHVDRRMRTRINHIIRNTMYTHRIMSVFFMKQLLNHE